MIAPLDLVKNYTADLGAALASCGFWSKWSPVSSDKSAIDRLAGFLADEFAARGAEVEIFPSTTSGNALKAVWRGAGSAHPIMLLGHLDTVWAPGTILERPFALRDGKAFGPGVFDMKSGILLCLLVCGAFREQLQRPAWRCDFLFHAGRGERYGRGPAAAEGGRIGVPGGLVPRTAAAGWKSQDVSQRCGLFSVACDRRWSARWSGS